MHAAYVREQTLRDIIAASQDDNGEISKRGQKDMSIRRSTLCCSALAGFALMAASFAPPALAAAPATMGGQNPTSAREGNLPTSTIRSRIAPALPSTGLGPGATVGQYLSAAQMALQQGKTGLAQHALENAETLALTRAVPRGMANLPDHSPLVTNINAALNALGRHDVATARHYAELAAGQTAT